MAEVTSHYTVVMIHTLGGISGGIVGMTAYELKSLVEKHI